MVPTAEPARFTVSATIPDHQLWWPHTHGEPALYGADIEIVHSNRVVKAELGSIGFRTVTLDADDGDFRIGINAVPVFCRGACWTPLDIVALDAPEAALDDAFAQLVESGMNMVRVGGTMVYESEAFLDRCDAHGVLLWQDFMFANMDYPVDESFGADVESEVTDILSRLQGRPSVAVLCGNSEGEQQAAMWGAPREQWAHPLFHGPIAGLARQGCPDVPYWPSSTHGGAFPHQGNMGAASYYGVGAYLRPLEDARRAEVRFASECLAFANVPEDETLRRLPTVHRLRTHDPLWKARTPRDVGAGWDFDDVRDHYLQRLFGVDPLALRYADHERYLDLGRVVTGEVMAAAFLEWRRRRSATRGALIWFLRDRWPGAGWGVVDAQGVPKAAWHYLRRALAPLAVGVSDEGCNGLAVHVINDASQEFVGNLELDVIHRGSRTVGATRTPFTVDGRSALELNAASLFDGFEDLSYAFRFGPPPHDLVSATVRDQAGVARSRALHFVGTWPSQRESDVGLKARIQSAAPSGLALTVSCRRFAQSVHVDVPGYRANDNYFHLLPDEERELLLRPAGGVSSPTRGTIRALNSEAFATVTLP
jgi:beta-mannosidase